MMQEKPFIVKSENALVPLARWLQGRQYNSCINGMQDKRGNPMIGLSWDWKSDVKYEKRGLIIVVDKSLREKVDGMVMAGMARDVPHGT